MSFTAPESLTEKIANYLSTQIVEGKLKSGERIQEARVVNDLQVSRGPVREALLLLEARYLITILPRRGAFVTGLTPESVEDLYDTYVHLLALLTRRVTQKWTDTTLAPLLKQIETIKSLPDHQPQAFIDAGFTLMRMAYSLSGNIYLCDTLTKLQPALHRTYTVAMKHNAWETQRGLIFFSGLLKAVMERKTEQLPKLIHDYGSYQCQLVISALEKQEQR